MATTGSTISGLDRIDQWLYSTTVPKAEKFWSYANRPFGYGAAVGMGRGLHHLGRFAAETSGAGYIHGAFGHYRTAARTGFMLPAEAAYNPVLDRVLTGKLAGPRAHIGMMGRRAASAAKVLSRGIVPGMTIYFAAQDEMGFGMGLLRETAGLGAWAVGGSLGLQMGGWAAATTGAAVGGTAEGGVAWALGKIPGIKKIGTTAVGRTAGRVAGAAVGGPLGFIIGGFAAYEMAKWGVGFALHTLPTFAKEFRSDMMTSGYGGDYVDTAGAITMRQRSLQAMGRSHTNARSALGQEASLLHV
jgi:hypothetical protein